MNAMGTTNYRIHVNNKSLDNQVHNFSGPHDPFLSNTYHLNFMASTILLDNIMSVSLAKFACQNENIFIHTYSYICQYGYAFASKLNLCIIFWPLFTKLVLFLAK